MTFFSPQQNNSTVTSCLRSAHSLCSALFSRYMQCKHQNDVVGYSHIPTVHLLTHQSMWILQVCMRSSNLEEGAKGIHKYYVVYVCVISAAICRMHFYSCLDKPLLVISPTCLPHILSMTLHCFYQWQMYMYMLHTCVYHVCFLTGLPRMTHSWGYKWYSISESIHVHVLCALGMFHYLQILLVLARQRASMILRTIVRSCA